MLSHDELVARKLARINETHRMDSRRTALLVIDMQRSFMDRDSSLCVPTSWEILPIVKGLVDFCRGASIHVIFTEFVSAPEIPTLRKDPFGPEHLAAFPGQPTGWGRPSSNCMIGTEGPESPDTVDELRPLPGEPVIRAYGLKRVTLPPTASISPANSLPRMLTLGLLKPK